MVATTTITKYLITAMTATISKNMKTTMTMTMAAFFIACSRKRKTKQEFNLHFFFKK